MNASSAPSESPCLIVARAVSVQRERSAIETSPRASLIRSANSTACSSNGLITNRVPESGVTFLACSSTQKTLGAISGSGISFTQATIFTCGSFHGDVYRHNTVEVLAQEIPFRLRLLATLLVGCTRHDRVAPWPVRPPEERPALPQPSVGRVLDVRVLPGRAAIEAHLDSRYLALPAPSEAADHLFPHR